MEGIANFACRPFSRGAEKHIKTNQHRPHKRNEKRKPPTPRKSSKHSIPRAKRLPKPIPEASGKAFGTFCATARPQDASKSALGGLRGRKKNLWTRPRAPQENFRTVFCPPQNRQPPRGGGAPRTAPLGFGAFFLKNAAGASAGCKNQGVQGFRGHSWGWGEKLKLLQQQASLLFKASLREA